MSARSRRQVTSIFTAGASSPRGGAAQKAAGGASAGAPQCPLRFPLPREATEGAAAATETRRLRRRRRRRRRRPGFLLRRRCPCGDAGGAGPALGASARRTQQPAPRPKQPGCGAALSPQGSPLGILGARDPSASAVVLQSNRPPTTDKLVSPPRGRPSAERELERVQGGPSSFLVNPLPPVLRRVQGRRAGRPPGDEGALLSGRAARAGLRRGVRATGPRAREVSPATEKPRGGIAPGRPAGIRRAIPAKRDPEKRGKEESLRRLKNIRALAEAGAAARTPLAASASRARLAPSGRGGGAPRRGALPSAGLRRAPS